jgi:isopenicillin N synthase-like dioxygenase
MNARNIEPAAALRMSSHQLPLVSLHGLRFGNEAERLRVAENIAAASERYGFFYLSDHGIDQEVMASGFAAARGFFELPLDQRLACRPLEPKQNRGYQPMFDTTRPGGKADLKESFDMGFPLPANDVDQLARVPFHSPNTWPDLTGFRDRVEALYFAMLNCGHQVLRGMALSLGADQNFFVGRCVKPTTNMRMVHYPPQAMEIEEGIGASAHTDCGLITLLLNDDNGGLHVAFDDEWIDAPPRDDAIIVNVGDLMTRWTNGRFRSAKHRVVNTSGRERYSIPQFHHPTFHVMVDPADLLNRQPDMPLNFEPVVAGDFVANGFSRDRKSWAAADVPLI